MSEVPMSMRQKCSFVVKAVCKKHGKPMGPPTQFIPIGRKTIVTRAAMEKVKKSVTEAELMQGVAIAAKDRKPKPPSRPPSVSQKSYAMQLHDFSVGPRQPKSPPTGQPPRRTPQPTWVAVWDPYGPCMSTL